MSREIVLLRVGVLHVILVMGLASVLAVAGRRIDGALVGGAAMAASLFLLWAMARSVVAAGRRALVGLLGIAKISMYLGLAGAALSGKLAVDGAGFAAGVACFLLATVAVTLFEARLASS